MPDSATHYVKFEQGWALSRGTQVRRYLSALRPKLQHEAGYIARVPEEPPPEVVVYKLLRPSLFRRIKVEVTTKKSVKNLLNQIER